jgi:hypothetical protein
VRFPVRKWIIETKILRADKRRAQRENIFQKSARATPLADLNRSKSSESVQVIRVAHVQASEFFARRPLHAHGGRPSQREIFAG